MADHRDADRPPLPYRSFDGRFNPPPKPKPVLPDPVGCAVCGGTGHGEPVRCSRCSGTGRVLLVLGSAYPATLKGRRYATVALRRQRKAKEEGR